VSAVRFRPQPGFKIQTTMIVLLVERAGAIS
jgi:hypothetical protein